MISDRVKYSGENRLEEYFGDFSIGKIMQISPVTF